MKNALAVISLFSAAVWSAELPEFTLQIKDHRFIPAELVIPADTKVKVLVKNDDATPVEFESHALNREKVVPGHGQAVIFLGPLKPGQYEFFDEFHEESTHGKVIVK